MEGGPPDARHRRSSSPVQLPLGGYDITVFVDTGIGIAPQPFPFGASQLAGSRGGPADRGPTGLDRACPQDAVSRHRIASPREGHMSTLTARRSLVVAGVAAAFAGGIVVAQHASGPAEGATPSARVVRGAGDIGPAVARYRALLGPDNGGAPAGDPGGRREITWDGVPDSLASPNGYPSAFFNAKAAPRARGAVLTTPGTGLRVSADADNPAGAAPRFADINPSYGAEFATFSAPRLFSPVGSNVVNLRFRVPGTNRPAVVRGFGAVYTGVDRRESTAFEYFDVKGRSLGTFSVPVGKRKLSFLGVAFAKPVVARVRIEYGNRALGPDETGGIDVAVMDDFIYGEPVAAK